MYSSTFIFHAKAYDEDFHKLNDEIAARARAIPGFLGEEEWHNEQTGLHAEVYYWDTLQSLHELIGMPAHQLAKAQHPRWLGPYRVVISEVISVYGQPDLGLDHMPPAASGLTPRRGQ